jgi:hypothetical protein
MKLLYGLFDAMPRQKDRKASFILCQSNEGSRFVLITRFYAE